MEQVKVTIKEKRNEILELEENIKSVSEQLRNIRDILYRICKKIEVSCKQHSRRRSIESKHLVLVHLQIAYTTGDR